MREDNGGGEQGRGDDGEGEQAQQQGGVRDDNGVEQGRGDDEESEQAQQQGGEESNSGETDWRARMRENQVSVFFFLDFNIRRVILKIFDSEEDESARGRYGR